MTDFNKTVVDRSGTFTGAYGNKSVDYSDFASVGVMANTDVFYSGKVSKNSIITGLSANLEAALSATAVKVGYVMGGVTVNDYFIAAAASGAKSNSSAMPLICTDDCYIIVTAGAATVADKRLAIVTDFIYDGDI